MSFLIAECGVNWDNVADAKEYVRLAADAGFTHAKFQLYDRDVIDRVKDSRLQEELERRRITKPIAKALVDAGYANRILVFFTVMYPKAMEIVDDNRLRWIKIRHADFANHRNIAIFQEIGAYDFRGTIFYSTSNAADRQGIGRIPLFCVPKYPAAPEEYDAVWDAGDIAGRIGFSLHAPDQDLFQRAIASGAMAVEAHVKRDGQDGAIDDAVSITFSEARDWIREVRNADASMVGQLAGKQGGKRGVRQNSRGPAIAAEQKRRGAGK